MARLLTQSGEPLPPPKKGGKYDAWLDGGIWELSDRDAGWFVEWRQIARALRGRARQRGMRACVAMSDDGTVLNVQAVSMARWRRRRP